MEKVDFRVLVLQVQNEAKRTLVSKLQRKEQEVAFRILFDPVNITEQNVLEFLPSRIN